MDRRDFLKTSGLLVVSFSAMSMVSGTPGTDLQALVEQIPAAVYVYQEPTSSYIELIGETEHRRPHSRSLPH